MSKIDAQIIDYVLIMLGVPVLKATPGVVALVEQLLLEGKKRGLQGKKLQTFIISKIHRQVDYQQAGTIRLKPA